MGELRLPGLATGIDTGALIEQMMIINSRRLARYQLKQYEYEAQTTALDDLRKSILALQSATKALSDIDDLEVFKASTSDSDMLTISASSTANPGSHSIEIDQLATTDTWIQEVSTFDYETDYIGGGDFIYSYNHQEHVVTAIEDVTTLEDFVNLINNDPDNPGVSASLLYQGGKYHLMLSGQDPGGDYQISVNESTTKVLQADSALTLLSDNTQNATLTTKITELYQFTENADLWGDETITISGKNHFGTDLPSGVTLSVTANTTVGYLIDSINEYYGGVATATLVNGQIRLTDHIEGTSLLDIDIGYDLGSGDTELTLPNMDVLTAGGVAETLTLLDSDTFIQTLDAQGSKIKVDGLSTIAAEEQTLTHADGGGGDFRLTYKGEVTELIASSATVDDIQLALEELSTVSPGDIVVEGERLSQSGTTTFTFLSTAGDVEMITIDASTLTSFGTGFITETIQGNDGWLNRNSNSITDALTGITLNLHDVTAVDEPVKITVTKDIGAIRNKVIKMASAYNQLMDLLAEQTKYNTDTKKMGVLSNNLAVTLVRSQARDPFIGIVDGFTDTLNSFIQASDIGLSIDGAGQMKFFTETFDEAINDDYKGVLEILGATKSGKSENDDIVGFYGASDIYTTAGTYHVQVKVTDNAIEWAKIKLAGESTYRDVPWDGNLIKGESNAENSLFLTVNLTTDGTYGDVTPLVVRVKQGFAGALEDMLDDILKAGGRIDTSKDITNDKITQMENRIYTNCI